jgi:hypothetical protein
MSLTTEPSSTTRPVAGPIILALLATVHLGYMWTAELRGMPLLPPAFVLSLLLGATYVVLAVRARSDRGFTAVINVVVGENLGFLAAGLALGYPWAEYLRPGTVIIVGLQFALVFPEIWRRQEAGRPIVAPARLAWFILAYALAFATYALVKPGGIWDIDYMF